MTLNFDSRLKELDSRFSVKQRQFKKGREFAHNDKEEVDCYAEQSIQHSQHELERHYTWPLLLTLFLLMQCVISSGSYSGEGNKPKFGDYEAQRHWMEITVNLPVKEWYFNTSKNNLTYWGLDYPPLTAYHSFLFGKIAQLVNNDWVALKESQGHESPGHKLFMRLSVIMTMMVFYAPIVFSVHQYWYCNQKKTSKPITTLFSMLCFPGLLYVDNGHFQYNHVPLGLFLWCFQLFCTGHPFVGSVLFVMALSFKQMSLYFALPIFVFLLVHSFKTGPVDGFVHVVKLGVVVILSFAVIWLPFLTPVQLMQVLRRIFPVARGLFEDKVATFWCAVSPFYKFNLFPIELMVKVSVLIVLLAVLPTLLLLARRPNEKNFVYSLFLCSMAFFLFSVQVHEKTILFVNLPALLLLNEHSEVMVIFLFNSLFSMFPLCVEDNLIQMYPIFVVYYLILLVKLVTTNQSVVSKVLHGLNVLGTSALVFALLALKPPARYPHLFPLLIAEYGFITFGIVFVYVYYKNIASNWSTFTSTVPSKKTN